MVVAEPSVFGVQVNQEQVFFFQPVNEIPPFEFAGKQINTG